MKVQRHGIILNTENFDQCVSFYRKVFELPVMFEKTEGTFRLTCLEFGDSYLMIETDGVANPSGKGVRENSTKLRFNVEDMEAALENVKAFGIDAEIVENDWGTTIHIFDPDGNRVGIRDEAGFHNQVNPENN